MGILTVRIFRAIVSRSRCCYTSTRKSKRRATRDRGGWLDHALSLCYGRLIGIQLADGVK